MSTGSLRQALRPAVWTRLASTNFRRHHQYKPFFIKSAPQKLSYLTGSRNINTTASKSVNVSSVNNGQKASSDNRTSGGQPNFFLRPATPEDYMGVVTLRASDPGHMRLEYLVYSYHDLLRRSDVNMTVGVLDGEIVAFGINQVGIEGGRETITGTTRTKPGAERNKYSVLLHGGSIYLSDVLQGQHVFGYSPFIPGHPYEVFEFRLQWTMDSFPGQKGPKRPDDQHINSLAGSPASQETAPLIQLSADTFCSALRRPELNKYLFPSGRFVMDTLVGRAVPENERFVLERKDKFVGFISNALAERAGIAGISGTSDVEDVHGSDDDDSVIQDTLLPYSAFKNGLKSAHAVFENLKDAKLDGNQTKSAEETHPQAELSGLLSFNTWVRVPIGYLSHIELYGRPSSSTEIQEHLRRHIQEIRRRDLHGGVKVTCEETSLGIPYGEMIREACEAEGLYFADPKPTKRMICKINVVDKLRQVFQAFDRSGKLKNAILGGETVSGK